MFEQLLEKLKQELPFKNRRLIVRRVEMEDHGCTSISSNLKTITITIRKNNTKQQQVETLIHEYPHALELDRWEPHDKRWGEDQAAAYRIWEKNFCED